MGFSWSAPGSPQEGVLGTSRMGKQLWKGLRWAGVMEGMGSKWWGDSPSLPAGIRQPGQSYDLFFTAF